MILEYVIVLTYIYRAIQIHQQYFKGQFPEVSVNIEDRFHLTRIVVELVKEIKQLVPVSRQIGFVLEIVHVIHRVGAQVVPNRRLLRHCAVRQNPFIPCSLVVVIMHPREVFIDILNTGIQTDIGTVYGHLHEVSFSGRHIFPGDLIRKSITQETRVMITVGQLQGSITIILLIVDYIVQFDIQRIFGLVGVVGTVTLVPDTNTVEENSVDYRTSDQSFVVARGVVGIKDLIPIRLLECDFDCIYDINIIKILCPARCTQQYNHS